MSFAFILPPVQGNVLNPPGQSRRPECREAGAGLGLEGGSPEERGDQESKPQGPGRAGLLETCRPSGRNELACPSSVEAIPLTCIKCLLRARPLRGSDAI